MTPAGEVHDRPGHAPPGRNGVPLLIGITGHRDLVERQIPQIRALLRSLLQRLSDEYPSVGAVLLTSMAEGADLLAAEVAMELGIATTCILPHPVAEARASLESDSSRQRFDQIYQRSSHVNIDAMVELHHERIGEEAPTHERRFQIAGAVVARFSTLLIAVWDGRRTARAAGTAWVVDYRRRALGVSAAHAPLPDVDLLSVDDNDLVYEIRCSRRSRPDPEDAIAVQAMGFSGRGVTHAWELPRSLHLVLQRMEDLNEDIARFAVNIAAESRSLSPPHTTPPSHLRRLDELFRAVDWLGEHYQRWFNQTLRMRYALWAAMALLLVSFKKDSLGPFGIAAIAGVLALFGAGFALSRWAHHHDWHRKYLDYRALAEGLRVEFYWELAGIERHPEGELAHEAFLQRQDIALQWIRVTMRTARLRLAIERTPPTPDGLAHAVAGGIGAEEHRQPAGQLRYYHTVVERCERRVRMLEAIKVALLAGGLLLAVVFAVELLAVRAHHSGFPAATRERLLFALALLPAFAAIFDTYVDQKADRVLLRQYRHMRALFRIANRELRATRSDAARKGILRSLGHACLAEHAQWVLGYRDKRIEGLRW